MNKFKKNLLVLVLLLVVGVAVIYKQCIYDYYKAVIN